MMRSDKIDEMIVLINDSLFCVLYNLIAHKTIYRTKQKFERKIDLHWEQKNDMPKYAVEWLDAGCCGPYRERKNT